MAPLKNTLKAKLKKGQAAIGTMLVLVRNPAVVHVMAEAGYDFLMVDMEHSAYELSTFTDICFTARAYKLPVLARAPGHDYVHLARALDLGAAGIIVPRVEHGQDAENLAAAMKYPPEGIRGAALKGAHTGYVTESPDFFRKMNKETFLAVQIETKLGVENVREIVSVKGVDAVLVGPTDLSVNLGCPGELHHPQMTQALKEIVSACNECGVAPGIHIPSVQDAEDMLHRGMRFVGVGTDLRLLGNAASGEVQAIRSTIAERS